MIETTFTLRDKRQLGYGLYGNEKGIPIVDFHGIPGSRREARLFHSFLENEDLCFIGVDRPGNGSSSVKHGFHVEDFVYDLVELLDDLKIDRFIAIAVSGGGPFALACARYIPARIAAMGIISGVGPAGTGSEGMHESNRKKFNLAQQYPWLARILLKFAFSSLRSHPDKLDEQLKNLWLKMSDPDQKSLKDPVFENGILDVTKDCIRNGVSGWVNEEILMAQPWSFRLSDIHCENFFLWHGMQDRNVPVAMAKAVAAQIPNCQATFLQDEGHISILYNHGKEIIDQLIRAASI